MVNAKTNGDVRNHEGIAAYSKNWHKDSSKDDDQHTTSRLAKYTAVVNGYYDGATFLYEWGWGHSFHFCRYYKGESFFQALARHEHYLSSAINLKPGMRVLDVGCGIGGPAREIGRFSDASIVGINNNEHQVERARAYTAKAGLSDQIEFVKGDFMKLTEIFGENSFDAVYAIEATCHAPSWEGVYGEILKVLKPGGKFGVYEWCMTERWNPQDPRHKEIAHGIEVGDGIPEMRTIKAARQALNNVGFQILLDEDLAERPDKIPWYYPLEGDIRKVQTLWDVLMVARMTTIGKFLTQSVIWGCEKVGLVPLGTYEVGEALKMAAVYLVKGGQEKVFTPMMMFVAQKPKA